MDDNTTHSNALRSIRETLNWDDDERQRELLRRRARQYAAPLKSREDDAADHLTVLVFRLGSEVYGVDVGVVRAVRVLPKVTPVPASPHFYRGVVNLRGQIITVMDLSAFFDMPIDEEARELIVVQANDLEIGLLARHVEDVALVPRNTLRPFEYIRYTMGVTNEQLVVLDIPQLLLDERLMIGGSDE